MIKNLYICEINQQTDLLRQFGRHGLDKFCAVIYWLGCLWGVRDEYGYPTIKYDKRYNKLFYYKMIKVKNCNNADDVRCVHTGKIIIVYHEVTQLVIFELLR